MQQQRRLDNNSNNTNKYNNNDDSTATLTRSAIDPAATIAIAVVAAAAPAPSIAAAIGTAAALVAAPATATAPTAAAALDVCMCMCMRACEYQYIMTPGMTLHLAPAKPAMTLATRHAHPSHYSLQVSVCQGVLPSFDIPTATADVVMPRSTLQLRHQA